MRNFDDERELTSIEAAKKREAGIRMAMCALDEHESEYRRFASKERELTKPINSNAGREAVRNQIHEVLFELEQAFDAKLTESVPECMWESLWNAWYAMCDQSIEAVDIRDEKGFKEWESRLDSLEDHQCRVAIEFPEIAEREESVANFYIEHQAELSR